MRQSLLLIMFIGVAFSLPAESDTHKKADIAEILKSFEDDPHKDLMSVIVAGRETILVEKYFNNSNKNTLVDVRSAGKSVTSLLMGIAIDKGLIASVDDTVATYWQRSMDTDLAHVKIADLLTMRSGLDADSNNPDSPGYEDNMDGSWDPLKFVLTVPNKEPAGTQYRYNSLAAYLSGVVITQASKQNMGKFAQRHLFDPLGINQVDWQKDRSGVTKGQGNLFINAQGFVRIAQLVLNKGKVGNQQVVSESWIQKSLTPYADVSAIEGNAVGYGYYWFQHFYDIEGQCEPVEVWFASGNGGNKLYIMPGIQYVVAIQSRAYGQGRGHRRSETILLALLRALSHSVE